MDEIQMTLHYDTSSRSMGPSAGIVDGDTITWALSRAGEFDTIVLGSNSFGETPTERYYSGETPEDNAESLVSIELSGESTRPNADATGDVCSAVCNNPGDSLATIYASACTPGTSFDPVSGLLVVNTRDAVSGLTIDSPNSSLNQVLSIVP